MHPIGSVGSRTIVAETSNLSDATTARQYFVVLLPLGAQ
jgi:hypothetical protein